MKALGQNGTVFACQLNLVLWNVAAFVGTRSAHTGPLLFGENGPLATCSSAMFVKSSFIGSFFVSEARLLLRGESSRPPAPRAFHLRRAERDRELEQALEKARDPMALQCFVMLRIWMSFLFWGLAWF